MLFAVGLLMSGLSSYSTDAEPANDRQISRLKSKYNISTEVVDLAYLCLHTTTADDDVLN